MKKQILIFTILIVAVVAVTNAAAQQYAITQSVIAAGGGKSADAGGITVIEGTIGQSIAGTRSTGNNGTGNAYSVTGGIWAIGQAGPTAAEVSISGRVVNSDKRGIRNVLVTLTGSNGESRTSVSSMMGVFRFANVPAGDTYIVSVKAKRYIFAESSRVLSITQDIEDLLFVADN